MRSHITIRELSKISGFSISTVSKALNGSTEISEKTRQRIEEKAKKLNYIPNGSARALRIKKTKIIAVIVPKIDSIFYSKIVSKIQTKAFDQEYRILILESFYCNKRELDCINSINDGSVDGVIIIRTLQKESDIESKLTNLKSWYTLSAIIIRVTESEKKPAMKSLIENSFDILFAIINNPIKKSNS